VFPRSHFPIFALNPSVMFRSKTAFPRHTAEHRSSAGNDGCSGSAMASSLENLSRSRYKPYFRFATLLVGRMREAPLHLRFIDGVVLEAGTHTILRLPESGSEIRDPSLPAVATMQFQNAARINTRPLLNVGIPQANMPSLKRPGPLSL
jgi:hypothetical protein